MKDVWVRAAGQLGLITVPQARATGVGQDRLERAVRRGDLERVAPGVLAIAGVPWTWERRALAALLALGPDAVLSHRAAAYQLGFDGFGECPIEVTVPRGRSVRCPLAVVHTTAALARIDRATVGRFPVTSAARTIIDLCASRTSATQVSAAIGSALRDGRSSELFLRTRLAALRGRRGVRLLDSVLTGPIAHSHLERVFLRLVRGAGLPAPSTQVIVRGERVMRVDAMWPAAKLVVEVMGHRFHVTRVDLQRDAHRRNELQELGYLVTELTTDDLADRPAQSMGRVRRNLAARLPHPTQVALIRTRSGSAQRGCGRGR